jgi:hypothetical protein
MVCLIVGLAQRFNLLFNSMLRHSHTPSHFKAGFIVPIVKDNQGDVSSTLYPLVGHLPPRLSGDGHPQDRYRHK